MRIDTLNTWIWRCGSCACSWPSTRSGRSRPPPIDSGCRRPRCPAHSPPSSTSSALGSCTARRAGSSPPTPARRSPRPPAACSPSSTVPSPRRAASDRSSASGTSGPHSARTRPPCSAPGIGCTPTTPMRLVRLNRRDGGLADGLVDLAVLRHHVDPELDSELVGTEPRVAARADRPSARRPGDRRPRRPGPVHGRRRPAHGHDLGRALDLGGTRGAADDRDRRRRGVARPHRRGRRHRRHGGGHRPPLSASGRRLRADRRRAADRGAPRLAPPVPASVRRSGRARHPRRLRSATRSPKLGCREGRADRDLRLRRRRAHRGPRHHRPAAARVDPLHRRHRALALRPEADRRRARATRSRCSTTSSTRA